MKASGQFEPRRRARRRALQALYQWQLTGQDSGDIIGQFLEEQDFSEVDTDLFRKLVNDVINSYEKLDEELQPFLDRPAVQLDVMESIILRIAATELLNDSDVPCRVVLDEAIGLARRFGAEQGHSYVNAVLDQAARSWRSSELVDSRADPA
jgi:N utilization substance protein B